MSEPTAEPSNAQTAPAAVRKFAPKRKPPEAHPTDRAGEALLAIIQQAAMVSNENRDRLMDVTHGLSRQLQAAHDRISQLEEDVEHFRVRAATAEKWLEVIEQEIEQILITPMAGRFDEQAALR
jgi:hypothetical protein